MNNPVRIWLKLSSNICLNGCLFVAQMAVENRNIRRLHVQKRSAMVTFRRKLTGGRRAQRTEGSRTEQTEALLCICSLTSHASLVATHRSTASSSSTPQSNQGWFWFPAAPIELQENHVRHTYPLHTDSLLLLYSPFGRKRPTIWLCTARRSIWSAELCKSDPAANKNSVVIIDYHGKCIPITLGLCLVRGEKVFMKFFYLFDH